MHQQPASNDSLDYERIGRFIFSFHRICGSVDALTETALVRNAPLALANRAASLAEKFHYITRNFASTREIELESTLHEAAEVQTQIDQWRSTDSRQ